MPTNDLRESSSRQSSVSFVVLLIGVVLIGVSLVLPKYATGRSQWSDEQAFQYQATSAELHSLSHQFADASESGANDQEIELRLQSAQEEFERLHSQLEAARQSPARLATIMQLLGSVMVAIGAVLYFLNHAQK
jgi:predicted PurR-regulated permease PerM